MYFDDRLGTVLSTRVAGEAAGRVQFRQLLDLLGTMPPEARGAQLDAAHVRLAELAATIPSAERARMIAAPGLRLRSPRLVAELASREADVASATIARADLREEDWLDLVRVLPVPARSFLRQRRDLGERVDLLLGRLGIADRGLTASSGALAAAKAESTSARLPPAENSSIGSLVKRIEAFRRARQEAEASNGGDAPRLPLGDALARPVRVLASFDFTTDAASRIVWADPGVAPMVIGTLLANAESGPILREAFRRRQPINGGRLSIAGGPAIAGNWQIDAAPAFDPASGGFAGYRGRMRRPGADLAPAATAQPDSESDRIRQLLHELRTPVNAIQGFAEIIQQQLFGPTPHEYRAIAASIASDGARILAGFEELERLAQLDSGALTFDPGVSDLGEVVSQTIVQLGAYTAPRSSGFTLDGTDEPALTGLAEPEARRLVWRLLAALAGASAPGEVLALRLRLRKGMVRLTLPLPTALVARGEALFDSTAPATAQALSPGMFGTGFALRLAASEARAAGGQLDRRDGKLRLRLPEADAAGLTHTPDSHSDQPGSAQGSPAGG